MSVQESGTRIWKLGPGQGPGTGGSIEKHPWTKKHEKGEKHPAWTSPCKHWLTLLEKTNVGLMSSASSDVPHKHQWPTWASESRPAMKRTSCVAMLNNNNEISVFMHNCFRTTFFCAAVQGLVVLSCCQLTRKFPCAMAEISGHLEPGTWTWELRPGNEQNCVHRHWKQIEC